MTTTVTTTTAIPGDEHLDLADMRRRIKAIFIGSVGNLVEWYDFYAYAAAMQIVLQIARARRAAVRWNFSASLLLDQLSQSGSGDRR